MKTLGYYYHSYTEKWYVVSTDGDICKEFDTEADAKAFIDSFNG